jgi:glycosyltransferase involved in cell wall biosynthesis
VTVIPNACDTDVFGDADLEGKTLRAATPWLGDRPMILYAGTLGLVNGVDYLVRLADRLRTTDVPDACVVVIGSGREHDRVRALADRLGVLGRSLFMLDSVPKKDVAAWFGAADLTCSTVIPVPELAANSANKVFDGWAAGRPVAVNHGGWIADAIRRTGAGLVWPAGDPAAAAVATSEFLTDPGRVSMARLAAQELAAGEFSRDRLFGQLHTTLVSVAAGHRQ